MRAEKDANTNVKQELAALKQPFIALIQGQLDASQSETVHEGEESLADLLMKSAVINIEQEEEAKEEEQSQVEMDDDKGQATELSGAEKNDNGEEALSLEASLTTSQPEKLIANPQTRKIQTLPPMPIPPAIGETLYGENQANVVAQSIEKQEMNNAHLKDSKLELEEEDANEEQRQADPKDTERGMLPGRNILKFSLEEVRLFSAFAESTRHGVECEAREFSEWLDRLKNGRKRSFCEYSWKEARKFSHEESEIERLEALKLLNQEKLEAIAIEAKTLQTLS